MLDASVPAFKDPASPYAYQPPGPPVVKVMPIGARQAPTTTGPVRPIAPGITRRMGGG